MKLSKQIMRALLFIVLAWIVIFVSSLFPTMFPPTEADADRLVEQLQIEPSYHMRAGMIRRALDDLGRVETYESTGGVTPYTFSLIKKYFTETQDEAVLEGLDSALMQGGWADHISRLYHDLKDDPAFVARYKKNEKAREALTRCVGLAWSREDYHKVVNPGHYKTFNHYIKGIDYLRVVGEDDEKAALRKKLDGLKKAVVWKCPVEIVPRKGIGPFHFGMTFSDIQKEYSKDIIHRWPPLKEGQQVSARVSDGVIVGKDGVYTLSFKTDGTISDISVSADEAPEGCLRLRGFVIPRRGYWIKETEVLDGCTSHRGKGGGHSECENGDVLVHTYRVDVKSLMDFKIGTTIEIRNPGVQPKQQQTVSQNSTRASDKDPFHWLKTICGAALLECGCDVKVPEPPAALSDKELFSWMRSECNRQAKECNCMSSFFVSYDG